ncbi:MAG: enoyl-ACP reductase [Methylococcales bacterium]|jgi:enoyl-[acyl-carrier protein] reductase I|nr:enoyl-ACP reductase [Methylococcales bacterium]MBT7443598.1 enoyl-ACP reductase [Methylococcales bacterium]
MGFLAGKRALIVGLASNRSIAWGIAQAMHREGAELAFTYQNERLQGRVDKMAAECDSTLTMPCDVTSDDEITAVFDTLAKSWDSIDIIVHSVAFADKSELDGDFVDNSSREGFKMAHDISAYSFVALAKAARKMMQGTNGSLVTLSYLGAERVIPNYNVMGVAKASLEATVRYMASSLGGDGIRVNAISAGPIKTLAAAGIKNFKSMLSYGEQAAPLKRNVSIEEVGNATAFICSDMASGITGELIHVDGGYHIVGMNKPEGI